MTPVRPKPFPESELIGVHLLSAKPLFELVLAYCSLDPPE